MDTKKTLQLLDKYYPNAHCELNSTNAEELLIATILSAQCTDVRVNEVTKVLFVRFPIPYGLANASIEDIEEIIRPTGFFRNKAKSIKTCAQTLVSDFNGKAPASLDKLTQLPGVGRKTANVVLGNAYGITSGIVVDTHVLRLSFRFGWTKEEQPEKVELDLQKRIPKARWIQLSHQLIFHGRRVCKARSPSCHVCFLDEICPKVGLVKSKRKSTEKTR